MMPETNTFRFLDLPGEIRLRIYVRFLGLVDEDPISIFSLSSHPAIINKLSGAIRNEMLDVYYSRNRFIISSQIGLRPTLVAAGPHAVSRIRRLQLEFQVRGSVYTLIRNNETLNYQDLKTQNPECLVAAEIDLLPDEPRFALRVSSTDIPDTILGGIYGSMEKQLETLSKESSFAFDLASIEALVKCWFDVCRARRQRMGGWW